MLPPETTATTRLWPRSRMRRRQRRGDRAGGRAFRDDVAPLGRELHRRARRRRAVTTIDSSTYLRDERPHRVEHRLAARAVDPRAAPVLEPRWPCRPRATSEAAPRSPAPPRTSGPSAAARASRTPMPASSPPPPIGATTASTSGRSSRISSAAVPLPLMKSSSSNGCTMRPVIAIGLVRFDGLPASSNDALTMVAPSRSMAASLVAGAPSMTRTDARRAGLARGERDALRGVAGAHRPDALGELRPA